QNLIFTLRNGSRYQEKAERNLNNGTSLIRMSFRTYKKVMDLTSFRLNKTEDSTFKGNYQMLSLLQLGKVIDSLKRVVANYTSKAERGTSKGTKFPVMLDTTGWAAVETKPAYSKFLVPIDTVRDSIRREWTMALKKQDSTDKAQEALRGRLD